MARQLAYFLLGTLDLNAAAGDFVVTGFRETTKDKKADWVDGGVSVDGRERTEAAYPNKEFSLTLAIRKQDTTDDLQTVLGTLYQQLVRMDDPTDTLWFKHRPAADTSWGRIRQIKVFNVDCKVPVDDKMWKAMVLNGIKLKLECEVAWRGTEVTLSQDEANALVENAHDGTRENYLTFLTAGIDGDFPALCRIEITSTGGSYSAWRVAQKKDFSQNLTVEFEGTNDTSCSGGKCKTYTASDFTGTDWHTFSNSNKTLTAANYYGLYRVLARVKDSHATGGNLYLRIRWGVTETASTAPNSVSMTTNRHRRVQPVIYSGDVDSQVWVDVPLGMVDFREKTWKRGSYEPLYFSIQLQAKRTGALDAGFLIDRIYLMPLDEGYAWIGRSEGASDISDVLVVDSDDDMVYLVDSGGNLRYYPSREGGPFHLDPHTASDVRIYFLWEEGDDPAVNVIETVADRTASVAVYATPRYL